MVYAGMPLNIVQLTEVQSVYKVDALLYAEVTLYIVQLTGVRTVSVYSRCIGIRSGTPKYSTSRRGTVAV